MKDLPAVEVHWLDAHGGDVAWGALTKTHHSPERVRTVGQLYKQDKAGVTIALSRGTRRHVDCYIFIPKGCIVSVTKLR